MARLGLCDPELGQFHFLCLRIQAILEGKFKTVKAKLDLCSSEKVSQYNTPTKKPYNNTLSDSIGDMAKGHWWSPTPTLKHQ